MESMVHQFGLDAEDSFSKLKLACLVISEGVVMQCNSLAQALLQLGTKKEWLGMDMKEAFANLPYAEILISLINDVKMQGKAVDYIWDNEDTFYIQAQPLEDGQILILIQDRTYEKKYEQLLFQKTQLESISYLAAGVAHELRNPLSVIQGFFQLAHVTSQFDRYYDTINSEIKRMEQIIEDFLSVSREKVEKKKVTPAELLHSVKPLIRSECLLHDVTFDFKLHDASGCLYVNENMIKQVMLNLLRNTLEAYEEETKERIFRIHAGRDGEHFIMMVEDNGPGMSESVIESFEKPFYTTKDTGTGIGIPMCKKIIHEHDGELLIDSVKNKGTKVTIKLPLVRESVSDMNSFYLQ